MGESDLALVPEVPHAYLAVDLFFLLSGFVLAHSYEQRLASGMRFGSFLRARLLRLYPLFILGIAINGALLLYGSVVQDLYGWDRLSLLAYPILFLPVPGEPGASLYRLNYPAWTLAYELVVNLVWALVARWMGLRLLAAVVLAAACALIAQGVEAGSIDQGGDWDGVAMATARSVFGFFAGVLLYRFRPHFQLRTSLAWFAPALLCGLLLIPVSTPAIDLVLVIAVFPALIWLASATEPGRLGPAIFLGAISYPVYAVHAPVLHVFERLDFVPAEHAGGILAFLLFIVLTGWMLDRYYDRPVRAWLARTLSQGRFFGLTWGHSRV